MLSSNIPIVSKTRQQTQVAEEDLCMRKIDAYKPIDVNDERVRQPLSPVMRGASWASLAVRAF